MAERHYICLHCKTPFTDDGSIPDPICLKCQLNATWSIVNRLIDEHHVLQRKALKAKRRETAKYAEYEAAYKRWQELSLKLLDKPKVQQPPLPVQQPNYWWPPQIWCQMSGTTNGMLYNRIAENEEGEDAQG